MTSYYRHYKTNTKNIKPVDKFVTAQHGYMFKDITAYIIKAKDIYRMYGQLRHVDKLHSMRARECSPLHV